MLKCLNMKLILILLPTLVKKLQLKILNSKVRAKNKTVEHAQVQKVSPFSQSNSGKKVDIESCCSDYEIGFSASSSTGGNFLEDKLPEDRDVIESGMIYLKKKKVIENNLQVNGNDTKAHVNTENMKFMALKNVV